MNNLFIVIVNDRINTIINKKAILKYNFCCLLDSQPIMFCSIIDSIIINNRKKNRTVNPIYICIIFIF